MGAGGVGVVVGAVALGEALAVAGGFVVAVADGVAVGVGAVSSSSFDPPSGIAGSGGS